MDNLYYTNELSKIEFNLLPILKGKIDDYPIGIKKYFWNNPQEFSGLLIELYKKKDHLIGDSLEKELLFDALIPFGSKCFIPSEYILLKKDELNTWVHSFLANGLSEENEIQTMLKRVIIDILVCCPLNKENDIWPIAEVANILEKLSNENVDDKLDISQRFSMTYNNRRGVISIENGAKEYVKSMEFEKYKDYYKFSHPVTSKALEIISNDYLTQSKIDKEYSTQGEN